MIFAFFHNCLSRTSDLNTKPERPLIIGQIFGIEPGHEKMCLMLYANNKGADQTAHPRSLISAFVVRCLDSIIYLDSTAEISKL